MTPTHPAPEAFLIRPLPVLAALMALASASPAAAQAPASDMGAILAARRALGVKPVETLTVDQARRQPGPSAWLAHALKAQGRPSAPDASVTAADLTYAADAGERARLYTPVVESKSKRPVVIYFHGGDFVTGDIDGYDATARLLASRLDAVVVSIDTRTSPEHGYGSQHADAAFAWDWAIRSLPKWGGERGMLAIVGEGPSGGNLAVATAMHARYVGNTRPRLVVVIDPWAAGSAATPSKARFATAEPFGAASLAWAERLAKPSPDDPKWDLTKADLAGLPPTLILNAEVSPLLDDGAALEQALKAAGDKVERKVYPGVTPDFFAMGAVVRGAYDAENDAIARIKSAFDIIYEGDPRTFAKPKTPAKG
jgi:acetyl esterase/lipase